MSCKRQKQHEKNESKVSEAEDNLPLKAKLVLLDRETRLTQPPRKNIIGE